MARHRTGPEKLSSREREALAKKDCRAAVSTVSLWELRLKWDSYHFSGARKGPADPAEAVPDLARAGCTFLSLAVEHATAELQIALAHKDPFDLLPLVQAQQEGLRLLTRDRLLQDHPLA